MVFHVSGFRINEIRTEHVCGPESNAPAADPEFVHADSTVPEHGNVRAPDHILRLCRAADGGKSQPRIARQHFNALTVNSGFRVIGKCNAGIHVEQWTAAHLGAFKIQLSFEVFYIFGVRFRLVSAGRHVDILSRLCVDHIRFRPVEHAAGFADGVTSEKIISGFGNDFFQILLREVFTVQTFMIMTFHDFAQHHVDFPVAAVADHIQRLLLAVWQPEQDNIAEFQFFKIADGVETRSDG